MFLEAKTMSKKALKGKVWQAINFLYQNFIQKKAFFVSDSSMCSIALIEKSGGKHGCFNSKNSLFSDFSREQCHFRVDFRLL